MYLLTGAHESMQLSYGIISLSFPPDFSCFVLFFYSVAGGCWREYEHLQLCAYSCPQVYGALNSFELSYDCIPINYFGMNYCIIVYVYIIIIITSTHDSMELSVGVKYYIRIYVYDIVYTCIIWALHLYYTCVHNLYHMGPNPILYR